MSQTTFSKNALLQQRHTDKLFTLEDYLV